MENMEDYDKQLLSMSLPQLHREMTQLRRQKTLDATYRLTACQAHIDLLGISQRDVVLWTVTGNKLGYDVRPIEQTKQFDPPIMIGDEEVLVYANMTPSLLIPLTHGMYTKVSTDLLREKLLAQDHPAGDNRSYDLTNYRDLAVDLLQSPELDTYFYGDVLKLACSSTKLPMLDALFGCVYEKQLAGTSPDLGDLPMSPAAASMMLLPLSTPLPRGRGEVKVPLAQLVTNWPDSGSLVVMNEKHAVVYSGDDGAMQKCAMLVDGVPTGGFYATNMRDTYLSSNARVYFAVSKDDFELITKYLEQAGKSATETRSLDEWGVILRAAVFNTHTQFLRDVSTETTLRIAGNLDAGVQPTIISAQSDDVQPLQAPDGAYVFLNGSPVWQFQKPADRVILVGNGAGAYIEMEDPRLWESKRWPAASAEASAEAIAQVVRTALKALRPSFSPDPEQINTVQLSVAVLRDSLKMYREVPEQNQRLLFAKDIAIGDRTRIEIHVDGRSQNVTDVSLLTADDSVVLVCTQEQVDFLCELMSTKIDVEKMDFAARNQLLTTIVATVPVQLLWKYLTDADGTMLKGALDSRRAAQAYAEEEAKRAAEREKQQAQVAEASLDGAMYALGNPARAVNPKLGALAGKDTVEVDKYDVTLSGEQLNAYLDTMYSGDVTPAFKRHMEDLDYVTIHVRRDTHGLLELGGSNVGLRGKSLIKQHWAVLSSIIRDLFDTAVRKYSGALVGDMERFSLTDLYRSLPIIIKRSTGPLQMSAKDDSFTLMRKDTHLLHKFELSSPTLVSDLLLFTWGTKYLNEKYFAFYTHLSNEQWAVLAVNLFGAGADVNNIDLKQMQDELDLRRYSWPQFLAAVSAPKVARAEPGDAEAARRVVWPSLLAELYGLGFRVSGPNQAKLSFDVINDRGNYDSSDRPATLTVSYTDASLTAQVTADNLPSGNVDEVYVLVDGSAEAVTQRVRDLLGTVKGASLIGDMPTPIAANYLLSGEDGAPIVSEMAREVLGYAKQGFIGAGTTSAASTLAAFSKLAAADNWGCLVETKNVGSLLEHPDMSNSFTLTSDGAVQVFEMQFSYTGDDKLPSDWVCGLVRVQADGAFCFWTTNGQPDSGWKRLISEMRGNSTLADTKENTELLVEEMQQPSIPTKAEADNVFSVFRDVQDEEGYLVAGAETMLMKSQPWISDTVEIPSMPVLAGVYSPDSLEESDLLSGVLSEGSLARGSLSGDCWAVFQTTDGRYLRVLSRVLGFRAFNRETASGTLYAPPKSFSSYTPRNYKLLQWAETGAVKNGPSHAGYAVLCDAGDELSKHLKNYNLDDITDTLQAKDNETYLLCAVPTTVGYAQFKLLPYEGHNILLGDKVQADDTPVLTEVNDTITPRLDTGAWVKDTASAMAAAGLPRSEVSLEMLMHFGMYIVECGGKFPLFASIGVDRDGVLYPDDLRGTGLRYSNAPDMLPLVSAKLVLGQLYEYYRNQARCPTIEGIKHGRLDKMPSCDWPASENAALQFACKQLVALGRKNNSRTENGIAVSAPKDYDLERQMFALFDKPLWSLSGVDLVKHYVSLLAFVHNTEKRNAVPAPTASTEPTTPANTTFRYSLFNRPAGIGTVPAGLEFSVEPRPAKGQPFYESARHGILVTKRPLTDAEIKNFELVRLAGEADLPDVAAQVAKPMLNYAAAYLDIIEQDSRMFTDKVTGKTRDMNIDVAQPDKLVAMVIDLLKQHVAKQ